MKGRDKKDEESGTINPYLNLDRTTVLQEARLFNETPINAKKCGLILTKLVYLLGQGEVFGRTEATEVFFAVTKLWQSKDNTLRRLVYLAVKELCNMADDVIIVTSSLTKDMTGREDMYRAPAIRTLCKITDAGMLQTIERYMKQALVDKSPAVSSAALVSSFILMRKTPDVVRRWANEVQEAVNSDNHMVQYHALALLYHIRKTDRLAVSKLVQKFRKQGLRSPYALCYLIRLSSKLLEEDDSGSSGVLFDFLESCLRHKCEVVIYEAASAIVRLPEVSSKELAPAVSVLQLFCSSPKPSLRFAAVRTLNKIAINHPASVATCNMDLEQLITDQNRSIATLAITTLLKTGAESSVDRLMKQISTFVSEISDEFKIVVIDAIKSLCLRYPRKHVVLMKFLGTMLRDEGGHDFKKAIVDTIVLIVEENPDAKTLGLSHLCEFIEDCEYADLACRILHLLGREGPKERNPNHYIRYIYNRVILEKAQVRAAAITTLAKFGALCSHLTPSICVLLNRCLLDTDDEVRDRATYYLELLQLKDKKMIKDMIIDGLQISVEGLERALQSYCLEGPHNEPFDLGVVPVSSQPITVVEEKAPAFVPPEEIVKRDEKPKKSKTEIYYEKLRAIPEFAHLGPLFHSSEPTELTETETEYVVNCVKHTFRKHIVFQFDIRNTLNDQQLENVTMDLELADGGPAGEDGWNVLSCIPCDKIVFGESGGTIYSLVQIPTAEVLGTFGCTLKFDVRDCDPNTGEPESDDTYPDEYVLEDLEVTLADHVQKIMKPNFAASWEEAGDEQEIQDTFSLTNSKTLKEAVTNLIALLGMGVCERSDRPQEGKSSHTLLMAGIFRTGDEVLVKAKFALNVADGSVTMNMAVRSSEEDVANLFLSVMG